MISKPCGISHARAHHPVAPHTGAQHSCCAADMPLPPVSFPWKHAESSQACAGVGGMRRQREGLSEELEPLLAETPLHVLMSLRPCLQVGLVTYGTHVHVHELGFSECAKAYVFQVKPLCSAALTTCSLIPENYAHFARSFQF